MISWYNPTMNEHRINRRQWLKATGTGAGIAFVGTTGATRSQPTVGSFEPQFTTMDDPEEIAECDTEIQQLLFAFDADSEDDEPIEVEPGDEFDDILDEFDVDLEPEGRVFEDGTWELDPIDVIIDDPEESIDTIFDLLEEFGGDDFDFDPSDIEDFLGGIDGFVEIRLGNQEDATQPIAGLFDPENEIVTADLKLSAEVDLTIDLDVPIFDPDDIVVDLEIEVEATLTTEETGDMDGSYEEVDDDELQLELVANDFLVPETNTVIVLDLPDIPGVDLPVPDEIDIDEEAGLPSPEGRNFLRLTLDVFFDPEIPDMLGNIQGQVAEEGGTAIPEANIEIANTTTGETVSEDLQSDDDGEYELTELPAGKYDVFAEAEGFRESSERVIALAQQTITPTIELLEDGAFDIVTIKGSLTNPEGDPLSGVEMVVTSSVNPDEKETTITDDDGKYEVSLALGASGITVTVTFDVDVPGYRRLTSENPDGVIGAEGGETREHDIMLQRERGTIEGNIEIDGSLAEGVEVEFIDRETDEVVKTVTTGSFGAYSAELPIGAYDVRAEHADGDMIKRAVESTTTEDNVTTFVNLVLEIPPGTITGTVTHDGEPIDGSVINAYQTDESAGGDIAGDDGAFEFDLPEGEYTLEATATVDDEDMSATEQITVEPDGVYDVDFELVVGPQALIPYDTRPIDLNEDGLYEGVRGKDELTIADVQALFTALVVDDPAVVEEPEFFNFSELDDSEVTIFDVQALFNRLQNKDEFDITS